MNIRKLAIKTEKLSDFVRRRSKLFHWTIADGKKELCMRECYDLLESSIASIWQESSWRNIHDAHFQRPVLTNQHLLLFKRSIKSLSAQEISIVKMGRMKALYMVISVVLGDDLQMLKESSVTYIYFWELVW